MQPSFHGFPPFAGQLIPGIVMARQINRRDAQDPGEVDQRFRIGRAPTVHIMVQSCWCDPGAPRYFSIAQPGCADFEFENIG